MSLNVKQFEQFKKTISDIEATYVRRLLSKNLKELYDQGSTTLRKFPQRNFYQQLLYLEKNIGNFDKVKKHHSYMYNKEVMNKLLHETKTINELINEYKLKSKVI